MVTLDGEGDGSAHGKAAPFRLKHSKTAAQQHGILEGYKDSCQDLPPSYPGENDWLRAARTEGLRECLEIIEVCMEESVSEASAACVREVSDFISGWRFGEDCHGRPGGIMGKNDLVPLAVVSAGLHLGDRKAAVDHIKKGLSMRGGSSGCPQVVTILRCQDCNTVESALSRITQQCLAFGGRKHARLPLFMDSLEDWYNSTFRPSQSTPNASSRRSSAPSSSTTVNTIRNSDQVQGEGIGGGVPSLRASGISKKGSHRRRSSGAQTIRSKKLPAVVVMLEDVEGLNKQVLRELMTVLAQPPSTAISTVKGPGRNAQSIPGRSRCGRGFPLALVAVASAGVGFTFDRLSPSAARQLSDRKFHFPSAAECANVLYGKLFLQGRLPIWMGPKVLSWMKASFRDSHHSVGTLSRQLQRVALEHFSRPGSYLCLRYCRPWLARYPLYEDCPREATEFFSQKLKRDSIRMTAAKLESLLGVSVPVRAAENFAAVSGETEQQRAKISAGQAEQLLEKAFSGQACNSLRLWFLHKVLTILGRAFGGGRDSKGGRDLEFDPRPIRVVDLFSRREQRAKELKKAAEAFRFLTPTEVSDLLRHLLDALTSQNKGQRDNNECPTNQNERQRRRDGCLANQNQRQALDAPSSVEGLNKEEALYLRRGAKRVMMLWNKAWSEGWAEPRDGDASLVMPTVFDGSDVIRHGNDVISKSVMSSRGSRLLQSALHKTPPRANGSDTNVTDSPEIASASAGQGHSAKKASAADSEPGLDDNEREEALMRACLVRELQLLFLHVMGEARDCPLGPGMESPPPLHNNASNIAEGFCFNDPHEVQASLCPLMRAQIDRGMMDGAGLGTSERARKRKEMSGEDQLIMSDSCLMYSIYTSQGKIIPRSEWFSSFKGSVTEAGGSRQEANERLTRKKKQEDTAVGEAVDPKGPAEMRVRFDHASRELAMMGYVKPHLSRRRKEDGKGSGPKGAVTRLVFNYTTLLEG